MFARTLRSYRNAYSGLSRSTWLLSLVMLINRSGTMVVPFLTLYLTSPEMGFTVGQAGIVFGMFGAGAFSGAYFGGKLTDRVGFYPVQLITLVGGGILFIVLGQMKTYPTICVFTFLLSFVNEAFRPANSTAIAFYSKPENRTRSYSLNRLAINLGWAVGSALGGVLAHINYELLFWVDGITNISAAGLMWFTLKPPRQQATSRRDSTQVFTKSAFRDGNYLVFIVLTILFASCFFQLFTNLPVYFRQDLHFSEPFIGMLMAVNGLIIAALEMIMIYNLEGKRRATFYISIGVLLVGLSFYVLNIPGIGPWLAAVMIIVVTFGEMMAMPFMNTYWINRTHAANRGEYAALYTMAWSAAQTLGPAGAAQVVQHFDFHILWWLVGSLCLLTGMLFWKLHTAKT
ncbi:MAG TPA: MFS transporter [Chitinophagaceae bacterium]|nr:MFS transporter [Chitinophagaceae bacterium]